MPISQVADVRYTLGPQEIKSENRLLVGYVTMNTRDRDEVSVVEDADALIQAKIESGELNISRRATTTSGPGSSRTRCGR